MNHAQLRAFHAVASEGGFTAAANRLNLTQPAVTLQVKALEQAYGVDLFHRRGRRVELTDTGAALYTHTLRLFRLEEETDDLLSSVGGMRRGRLRVGADGPAMIEVLQDFQRLTDDRMAFLALDMGNKAHTAGIMFIACIVKTQGFRKSHR